MDFDLSQEHEMIKKGIAEIASDYGEEYWRERRYPNEFPEEFWQDLADGGWLGVSIPEEYGGMGMGMLEMALVIEELGKHGCWEAGNLLLLNSCFGGITVAEHGNEHHKKDLLPKLVNGEQRWCLGVTESDAGLNTKNLSTTAEKDGDEWVLNGQKMWTSGAEDAAYCTLIARTTPVEDVPKDSLGISLFLVPMDADGITLRQIELDGYFPDKTYEFDLDGVRIGEDMLLGEEDRGLYHVFATLNTERIAAAAIGTGSGYAALNRATDYASDREVFDEPIGAHQAIQHPLADAYADLETASLYMKKAAWLYDQGQECGKEANVAKLKSAEAAYDACEAAMTTFGGMSIASDIGISPIWQSARHYRIAPVSEQMVRNYIGEHVLGLPKSY
jgi:acyl-CoA dehydrogenase